MNRNNPSKPLGQRTRWWGKAAALGAFFALGLGANAQVSTYVFSTGSDPYVALAGSTPFSISGGGGTADDGYSALQPIGFTFNFGGTGFTQFSMHSNGWLRFGAAASATDYTPMDNATMNNLVVFNGRDLNNAGAVYSYRLDGSPGSYICKIEASNFYRYNTATHLGNAQVWLYEATGVVEIRYGSYAATWTSGTCQVGIRTTNTDVRKVVSATWAGVTAGSTDAVGNTAGITQGTTNQVVSGTVFTFTPPVPCSGIPNAGSVPTPVSVCSGNTTILTATGLTPSGPGLSYQWQESPDGIGSWASVVGGSGATTASYTTTAITGTRYFRLLTTCSTGPDENNTNVVTVNVNPGQFDEDFSSGTIIGNCWSQSGTGAPANLRYNAASGFGVGAGSIIWDFFSQSGTTLTLIYTSPVITPTSAGQEISFDVAGRQYDATAIDSIYLEQSNDGGTTWSLVVAGSNAVGSVFNTLPISTTELNTPLAGEWASRSYTLATGTNRVRFRGVSKFGNNVLVDNIALPLACAGPVDPGATESTTTLACATVPFTLSLENATSGSGVTYQWFASTTSASGPFDITGPTTSTWTTSQTVPTWYYCQVTCANGPATGDSDVLEVGVDVPSNCYCEPTYTFGKTDGDLLSNVVIVGTTLANNTGTDPVNPAYTYFNTLPNHTADLQAGTSYTIQATVGTFGSQNIAVWIDFNEDGVFATPSERVGFTTTPIGSNGTGSFVLSLPCNPTPGVKRMRVRDVWNTAGNTIDPCANYGYGETEDYDVTILAPPACPQPTALAFNTVTFNSANITWNVGCTETAWEIEYGPTGFTLGTGTTVPATSPYALGGLSGNTGYDVYVRADCGGNGLSASAGPVNFTTPPAPPANDLCANAIAIGCNSTVSATTANSTNTGNPGFCDTDLSSPGVWYTVQGWDGPMTASLCGSVYDTKLGVFTGSCGAFTCVAGNDDACGLQSAVNWTGTNGTTYYIYVTGFNGATGSFTLTTTCGSNNNACPENGLTLEIQSDANFAQTSWEILAQGTNVVAATGGGLPGQGIVTQFACLPDGCYRLRVLDSGNDGIANGGYILRTQGDNQRVIDNRNNGNFTTVSAVIGNGGFCLPLGTDKLIFTSCDKMDWVNNQFIVAAPNPAVSAQFGVTNTTSGYQFWFFDPNGTYGYAKFRSHATSDGFGTGATRACHARINNWSPNQIPANVLMNVKVRGRVAGNNLPWGPVCRFMIDPVRAACPLTKLVDIPGNTNYSCGVTRTWGGSSLSKVVAKAVDGATQYQFRWNNAELAAPVIRTTTTPVLQLNWNPALPNGTYQVQVRAFKNGQWCVTSLPWGDECNVTITGSPNAMSVNGGSTTSTGDVKLAMFPNPNNGEQLTVSLSAVEEGVETISVDIFDLSGARVSSRTMAVNDGMVYQVLSLGEMADGLYMVNITAGTQRYTERLVIAK